MFVLQHNLVDDLDEYKRCFDEIMARKAVVLFTHTGIYIY